MKPGVLITALAALLLSGCSLASSLPAGSSASTAAVPAVLPNVSGAPSAQRAVN